MARSERIIVDIWHCQIGSSLSSPPAQNLVIISLPPPQEPL